MEQRPGCGYQQEQVANSCCPLSCQGPEDLSAKCVVSIAMSVCPVASAASNADYLVKWQGLPYSECTQEDAELIRRHFPLAVDEYTSRQKSTCLPSKNCKVCTSPAGKLVKHTYHIGY